MPAATCNEKQSYVRVYSIRKMIIFTQIITINYNDIYLHRTEINLYTVTYIFGVVPRTYVGESFLQ